MICRGRHGAVRLRRRATWLDDDSTRDTGRRLREFGRLQDVSLKGPTGFLFLNHSTYPKDTGSKKIRLRTSPEPPTAPGAAPRAYKIWRHDRTTEEAQYPKGTLRTRRNWGKPWNGK